MSFFKKNPLITLGLLALLLVGLPAAIFLTQKPVEKNTHASGSVILSFAPTSSQSSPINVQGGASVTLDVMLNPGSNIVSFLKTEINYDPSKIQVGNNAFQPDLSAFPNVIQQPIYSNGKIQFVLSAGADPTKAIQKPTKVGTLTVSAAQLSGTTPAATQITFNSNTQALSIDPNSTPIENVISSTTPAYLLISQNGISVAPPTPTSNPTACTTSNQSDTMLVIDKSGSMSVASDVSKITQAKIAAKNYVDIISQDTRNAIGLVSYENTATVNSPLTTNYASVKTQIDSLTAIGSTCTECAILAANAEIAKSTSSDKKVVVLLTDGKANFIEGGANQVDTALAEQKALAAAIAGHNAKGTVFYTIGLGQEINASFLQQISQSTGGKYFPSPTADQLNGIYNEISQIANKGSISGKVYNDANNNGVFDSNESVLPGWTIQLFSQGSNTPQTFTSDGNGFNITGLCNGTYIIKEVLQNGWRQTQPTDPNGYTIVIVNGNAIIGKNFGNNHGNTCSDGLDNNNNGLIDINDPVCHTDGNPDNPGTYDPNRHEDGNTCADGKDNNGNNLIDRADPICHTDGNPNNPGTYDPHLPENGNTCSDKKDNNNNGLIDINDPVCHTDGNPDNPGTYDPNRPEDGNTCADGKDNNGNNLIDRADPICHTDGNPNNPGTYDPHLPENGGNGTTLNLTVFLHGIGNSGDNATNLNSLSNKNPLHKTRDTKATIFSITNQIISTSSGQITYQPTTGNYTGAIQTATPLAAGSYNVKIGTTEHLIRLVPGIQTISIGANILPPIAVVAGDINNDNKLNILDYNTLLDCYNDTLPAPSCTDANKKVLTDLNDDGSVNGPDYNLFIRELSTQPGE